MQNVVTSAQEYVDQLSEERKEVVEKLRTLLKDNLPNGFEEGILYGMISYHVPHSLYPSGYHCDPKLPLPFISIASQKNFVAVYHMGIYANPTLLQWFVSNYALQSKSKLDMGKSCIRFKKIEHIPFELLGQLAQKMTVSDWISTYETAFKK